MKVTRLLPLGALLFLIVGCSILDDIDSVTTGNGRAISGIYDGTITVTSNDDGGVAGVAAGDSTEGSLYILGADDLVEVIVAREAVFLTTTFRMFGTVTDSGIEIVAPFGESSADGTLRADLAWTSDTEFLGTVQYTPNGADAPATTAAIEGTKR